MGWNLHFSSNSTASVAAALLQIPCRKYKRVLQKYSHLPWTGCRDCLDGGKKKRNLLQNSVSSLVKGIYFILNVIPPKQILFLNLSLSLEGLEQRAALGCCRPGCALSVARLGGGRTGQGNPIPGKRAQRWSCRGQGLLCQIQRVWGVSISSRHCPQPSQGWAPVGAESDPNPMQTPTPALLGAALFYFTIALFLYTIYEIEVYIYKFI